MATTIKRENWNKSTPAFWRNFGDALLVLGAGLNAVAIALPVQPQVKVWIVAGTTLLTTAGKFITKLTN